MVHSVVGDFSGMSSSEEEALEAKLGHLSSVLEEEVGSYLHVSPQQL